MGAGDDVFVWNPGDDNDTVEGQDGFDTLLFNGANIAEQIDISANGERVRFFRDIANVDDGPQRRRAHRLQCPRRRRQDHGQRPVRDGRDARSTSISPARSAATAGDGAADTIVINATSGDDVVLVVGDAGGVSVLGLAAQVNIVGFEAAIDRIVINGLCRRRRGRGVRPRGGRHPAHRQWRRRRRRAGRRRRQRHAQSATRETTC